MTAKAPPSWMTVPPIGLSQPSLAATTDSLRSESSRLFRHPLGASNLNALPIDLGFDAAAGYRAEAAGLEQCDLSLLRRTADGDAQRIFAVAFGAGRQPKQTGDVFRVQRDNSGDGGLARRTGQPKGIDAGGLVSIKV